jgi:aryl-alcohol dehydrogenase-like predicted oxidoreductase
MHRLLLGRSGHTVSALGLGCVGMSSAYGPANDESSIATMRTAVECGIDFFDTADLYGQGHNEELIGRFLKDVGRNRVIVATKFGSLSAGPDGIPRVDNSPEHIARACEASLQRLGTDVIDLYYMHRRDPRMPIADSVGAMARLVESGKVRWLGLSEVAPDTLRQAHAVHPIAALQSEYSLWFREIEDEILPVCRELGVSLVAFCPLGRAFLTGKMPNTRFDTKDIRSTLPRFQERAVRQNKALVEELAAFAVKHAATAAQVALSWLLSKSNEHISVIPIPGTKQSKYVVENGASAELKLNDADIAYLESIFSRSAVVGDRYSAIEAARAGT